MSRAIFFSLFVMFVAALPTPGQQQSASAPGWQQAQKSDAGRDTSSRQFTLAGKYLTKPKSDPGTPPTLVVACRARGSKGRFSSASVNPGVPLDIEYVEPSEIKAGNSYYPKVDARYRLDDGKAEKEQWSAGTDKASATFSKSVLEKMLRAHTVEITVKEFKSGEISMQFDIPDSPQLESACGVSVRKK
ncbi:MAG: hypothetical protein ACRD5M_10325 [Candidatus Acidiferrales bacterium]